VQRLGLARLLPGLAGELERLVDIALGGVQLAGAQRDAAERQQNLHVLVAIAQGAFIVEGERLGQKTLGAGEIAHSVGGHAQAGERDRFLFGVAGAAGLGQRARGVFFRLLAIAVHLVGGAQLQRAVHEKLAGLLAHAQRQILRRLVVLDHLAVIAVLHLQIRQGFQPAKLLVGLARLLGEIDRLAV